MSRLTAWSYSRLHQWEECPLMAKEKFITKSIATDDTPAMQRGKRLHDSVAKFLTGANAGVDREAIVFPRMEALILEIKNFPDKVVEQQWGFTSGWLPTGWFGNDTWFRSILDAGVLYQDNTAEAVDWKTGKKYGSNMDQMKSQAVAMFGRYRMLTHVTVRLAYLDSGEEEIEEVRKCEIPAIKQDFEKRVAKMFADTIFAPRPNKRCRFCPLARSNGGKCAFG
jgi:hypothetical protein